MHQPFKRRPTRYGRSGVAGLSAAREELEALSARLDAATVCSGPHGGGRLHVGAGAQGGGSADGGARGDGGAGGGGGIFTVTGMIILY